MKNLFTSNLSRKITLFFAVILCYNGIQAQSYIQATCDYAPLTTDGTVLCLGDDGVSAAVPLGFTFNFYEVPFTDVYISSNGYLSFTAGLGSGCCTGAVLPSGTYPYSIFFGQEDLDPNTCVDGVISYYTTGAPGSQIFVMSFVDVPHYPGPAGTFPVTVQVQLYEGTDEVRIVTTAYNSDGGLSTMGLNENVSGADVVPGRNSEEWSAYEECISFIPDGLPDFGCTDPAALNYDPTAEIEDGSCFFGYVYNTCEYDLMSTEGTVVCLGDDAVSAAVPVGFDFPFYGNTHNQAYIGSNGFVSFTSGLGSACCTGQILPSGTFPNTIFIGQEDMDPNSCVDGEINYYTTGVAGSQIFVVNFIDVPHYPGPEGTFPISVQLQCYEATGEVKIVATQWNSDGGAATMGLNYNDLYADPVPGRNSEIWDAFEECHSWLPLYEPLPVCEVPSGLFVDGLTDNDAILHWNEVEGADQYRVTLQNTATGLIKTKGYYTNMVEVTDKLTPLTTYAFRVKTVCYDDLGEISDPSEWFYFTTLGKFGELNTSSVSLYPNPSNGTFNINIVGLENEELNINVYDAIGNIIYTNSISVTSNNQLEYLNLDAPAGMYFVSVNNASVKLNYPIVIQK